MSDVSDLLAALSAGAAIVVPAVGYLWRELVRTRRLLAQTNAPPSAKRRSPLVLLVEDNPLDAALFVAAVEPLDVRVVVAPSAEKALVLAADWPAVIVVDARLPGLSGVELVQRIRPAVVVLSAADADEVERQRAACRADLGLQKRGDPAAVREAIAGLVR